MRYKHPLIIYELDGVLADCAIREAEAGAAGSCHGKGSLVYWQTLFDPHRLKQDLLVDKGRDLVHQLWKDNVHQIILTKRPLSLTRNSFFHEVYNVTMAWCLEQGLMPGWFRTWTFRERRGQSEALWKPEQVYLYVGKHAEVDHLYVVDKNEENRYAIGYLCHELYLGIDLLDDIQALEAALRLDKEV